MAENERYEFLKRLALGEKESDPILHWGGFVRYAEPPKAVADQAARLAEVKALTTCSSSVPVTDTFLMLADVAAKVGKSRELAVEVAKRIKKPGDAAAVATGIVRLAATEDGYQGLDLVGADDDLRLKRVGC